MAEVPECCEQCWDRRGVEDLCAQVARLEGELTEAQKELESKDEELRLAREDFSPEAWEDLLQRLEKSEAAIRAKDAALEGILREFTPKHMDSVSGTTVGSDARAALSPDAGKEGGQADEAG